MKNLKFLVLFALFGFFVSSSTAQSEVFTTDFPGFNITVTCDGVSDVISGLVTRHTVKHVDKKTGNVKWQIYNMSGEGLQSAETDEVFKVHASKKIKSPKDDSWTWRVHFNGDAGTVIIANYERVGGVGPWTLLSTKCM